MDGKAHSLPKSEPREQWMSRAKSLFWRAVFLTAIFLLAFQQESVAEDASPELKNASD